MNVKTGPLGARAMKYPVRCYPFRGLSSGRNRLSQGDAGLFSKARDVVVLRLDSTSPARKRDDLHAHGMATYVYRLHLPWEGAPLDSRAANANRRGLRKEGLLQRIRVHRAREHFDTRTWSALFHD